MGNLGSCKMKHFSVDDKISPRSAALCMAMCGFLLSISGALVKYIDWDGTVINCLRSLIAGVSLCIYLRIVGKKVVVNKNTLIAGCFVCVKYTCFILGNKFTSSATMIALQYTSPVFILIISFLFFGQKIKGKDMAVAVAAMIGVLLLTLDRTGPSSLTGNLMGLTVGVTTALMYLFTAKSESYAESLSIITIGHLYTAAVMMPFVIGADISLTVKNVSGILVLGVIQQAMAYSLYSFAIRSATPLTCNLVGCIDPLFNPIWSAILIKEIPGPMTVAGFAVVLISVAAWSISNAVGTSETK